MSRVFSLCAVLILLAACSSSNDSGKHPQGSIAQFWRPISEPNIGMPLNESQVKLQYDISQCSCGIGPVNIPRSVQANIDLDRQRLNETAVLGEEVERQCQRRPSYVVGECMRARGWEVTNCSGRMPVAGGAAVCAGYSPVEEED